MFKFNAKGFSLVEIMVTVGVMGIAGMALMSQMQISTSAKKDISSIVVINSVIDKISYELSNKQICSDPNNLGGKNLTTASISAINHLTFDPNPPYAMLTQTPVAQVGSYYGSKTATNMSSGVGADTVKIDAMSLTKISNELTQLNIDFRLYTGSTTLFSKTLRYSIPLTVISTLGAGTTIQYCFNDLTNSIQSAVRLSCQGDGQYYDPSLNPPYGACLTDVDPIDCSSLKGSAIYEIGYNNGSSTPLHKLYAKCRNLYSNASICPAGKVIKGILADGSADCDYPFPNCPDGTIIVKSTSGQYICTSSTGGCSGLSAVQAINPDGSFTCAPFAKNAGCAGNQWLTSLDNSGNQGCSDQVKPITCPPGSFLKSFDSSGNGFCAPFVNLPINCPGGLYRIDTNGNAICAPRLTRMLKCNSGNSPNNLTEWDCTQAGGTVQRQPSDSVCVFNSSSCPGSFAQCNNWRETANVSCHDIDNSGCYDSAYLRGPSNTQSVNGTFWGNPVFTANTPMCSIWNHNSPSVWGRTNCYVSSTFYATTPIIKVGCY